MTNSQTISARGFEFTAKFGQVFTTIEGYKVLVGKLEPQWDGFMPCLEEIYNSTAKATELSLHEMGDSSSKAIYIANSELSLKLSSAFREAMESL